MNVMSRKMFNKSRPARDALNKAGGIMDSSSELMQEVQGYPVQGVQNFANGSNVRIPGRSIYAEEGPNDGTIRRFLKDTFQQRMDPNYNVNPLPGSFSYVPPDQLIPASPPEYDLNMPAFDERGVSTGFDEFGNVITNAPRQTFEMDFNNPTDLSETGIASQLAIDKAAIEKFQAANPNEYVPLTQAEILAKQAANPDLVKVEGTEPTFGGKMDPVQERALILQGTYDGLGTDEALKLAQQQLDAEAKKRKETDFVAKIAEDEDDMATRERVMGDTDQDLKKQAYVSKVQAEKAANSLINQQKNIANESFERARRGGNVSPEEQMKNEVQNVIKNGTPEEKRSSLKELMAQFTDNAPEYKGINRGLAIAKIGFAIAAGQSPNALTNIANGLSEGADAFIEDAQKRDAFKRQVSLSALQYGLGEESKYRAEDRTIRAEGRLEAATIKKERRGAVQVTAGPDGATYNGKTYSPYSDFYLNKSDIYDNTVPDGIMSTSTITALGAKAKAQAATLKTLITNGTLKTKEANTLRSEYSGHVDNAIKAERSLGIIQDVMLSVGDEGITGLSPAIEDFKSKLKTAFGRDVPEGGWTLETSRAKFRNVLQTLIPLSLGESQSANSISNRDVEFLISAYFGDDALSGSSFSFVLQNDKTILRNLGMIADIFQNGQKKAFSQMTQIEMQMLPLMQAGTVNASGVGVSSIGLLSPEQARLADTVSLNLAGGKQTPSRTVGASTGYSRNEDGILVFN